MNEIINLIKIGTYFYPDHSSYYPHWKAYILDIYEDGYQICRLDNVIYAGYELVICLDKINEVQFWAYGQRFFSEEEMKRACKNKVFW